MAGCTSSVLDEFVLPRASRGDPDRPEGISHLSGAVEVDRRHPRERALPRQAEPAADLIGGLSCQRIVSVPHLFPALSVNGHPGELHRGDGGEAPALQVHALGEARLCQPRAQHAV